MKVRCERDGEEFEVTPRGYPFTYSPDKVIDCPKCGRGYFLDEDGVWRSDRDLTIIEG